MPPHDREFEEFVLRHEPRLRRFVTNSIADHSSIDDLLQSAFFTAWKKFETVRTLDEPAIFPWLCEAVFRHASNERRSLFRRLRKSERLANERSQSADSGHDVLSSTLVDLRNALLRLSPETRKTLFLVLWDDASPDQIASTLGCSRDAASKRIQRALADLRVEFTDER